MIIVEDLTLDDLFIWEEDILNSQQLFHPKLRVEKDELSEIVEENISKIAKVNFKYAGHCLACRLLPSELPDYFSPINKRRVLDLYHIAVDVPYQRQGVGTGLVQSVITSAKEKGFRQLIGWYNLNSLPLIKKFGAVEIEKEQDWYESGEEYTCCVLDI